MHIKWDLVVVNTPVCQGHWDTLLQKQKKTTNHHHCHKQKPCDNPCVVSIINGRKLSWPINFTKITQIKRGWAAIHIYSGLMPHSAFLAHWPLEELPSLGSESGGLLTPDDNIWCERELRKFMQWGGQGKKQQHSHLQPERYYENQCLKMKDNQAVLHLIPQSATSAVSILFIPPTMPSQIQFFILINKHGEAGSLIITVQTCSLN